MRVIVAASIALLLGIAAPAIAANPETITIDAAAPTRPFPHFWERMFGSGRAVLTLRASYRDDLRAVRGATSIAYVRFHGIFNDEIGIYSELPDGQAVYNFSYTDQVYDGLLASGVRPVVELSFMPRQLAANSTQHSFWYHPFIAPPKDYARWDALITAFARHLVERYGIEEVSQWYFEVWNEPNLDFWAGEPRQSTYWSLYDHAARSIKAVDARLRVGGPATAQAAWVAAFIRHCQENGIPVDFVSTHVYGDDSVKDVFGDGRHIAANQMVCPAVRKVHEQIRASALPSLPLLWTEFNATYRTQPEVTDAPFMGPWLAETVRQCDGLTQEMSYWTFSDVFEEQGVVKTPFYGGYGLLAVGGIPKPAFNAFALLHGLGEERFVNDPAGTLVTRRSDGTLVVALWNYAPVGTAGNDRRLVLRLTHATMRTASVQSVDREHGNVRPAYERMGSPPYPTIAELVQLRKAAEMPAAVEVPLSAGTLNLDVPPDGLLLVTLVPGTDGAR